MIFDFQQQPNGYSRPLGARSSDDIHVRPGNCWPPITLCQRPSSTGPSTSRTTSASTEIIIDLGDRLEAAKKEIQELNATLEWSQEKATKLVERLLRQKQKMVSALEQSEAQRDVGTQSLVLDRSFEKVETETDSHHHRPDIICRDCSEAHAARAKAEKEAEDLRFELGHANHRIEVERNASRAVAVQAEGYQKLVDLQHREIKSTETKLDTVLTAMRELKKENEELLVERQKQRERERNRNPPDDNDLPPSS
ncbi:hypothetical protein F4818DRAFT_232180 [Hypoxylon cercidicola]|nr:hypothetical protein F4818DRAFT_232180 [Hypoxylon cercidicola]